jgi:hypothetical protein
MLALSQEIHNYKELNAKISKETCFNNFLLSLSEEGKEVWSGKLV